MALFVRVLAFESAMAAILFITAGRWDLPWFWAFLGVHASLMIVLMSVIDPELRQERLRPGPGGVDEKLRPLAILAVLAHLTVAGLDVGRFHWSGDIRSSVESTGLIGYAAGMSLSVWAMASNRFFSPLIRIQRERGHHTVDSGPYRFLRHPGYAGLLLCSLCGGVALGSWWSIVPMVPFAGLFVRRTLLEERILREELTGYAAYSQRVRYRIVPGMW